MTMSPALVKGGNGSTTAQRKAYLPPIFPWDMGTDLIVPVNGCGLGNPMMTNAKNMAEPFREQVGLVVFTRDAVTGNLVLPGSSVVNFFTTGEGEPVASNVPLPLFLQNVAVTNLFRGGTPVTRDNLFAMVAMGVGVGRPFALHATEPGGGFAAERHFSPWTDSYGQRIRDAFWTLFGFSVSFRDAACNFELGTPSNYVPAGGQYGADTVRAGGGFGVLGMLPILRGPVYLGAQDEQNQATITMTSVEEDVILDQDDEIPTVDALAVPVLVTGYGDYGAWCGPCGPNMDDIDAAVLKRMPALLAAMGVSPQQIAQGLKSLGG